MSHHKTWEPIREEDGARRYVAKYATKTKQKDVPEWFGDIGRFWGASRGVKDSRERPRIVQLTDGELREILTKSGRKVGEWDVLPRYLWGVSGQMFDGM